MTIPVSVIKLYEVGRYGAVSVSRAKWPGGKMENQDRVSHIALLDHCPEGRPSGALGAGAGAARVGWPQARWGAGRVGGDWLLAVWGLGPALGWLTFQIPAQMRYGGRG